MALYPPAIAWPLVDTGRWTPRSGRRQHRWQRLPIQVRAVSSLRDSSCGTLVELRAAIDAMALQLALRPSHHNGLFHERDGICGG